MLSRSYALPLNGIKAKVFVLSRRVSYSKISTPKFHRLSTDSDLK